MRQSKHIVKLLAAALALGTSVGVDAKTSSTRPHGVHGVVISVQESASQITVRVGSAKKGKVQTVRVTIGTNTTLQFKSRTEAKTNSSSTLSGVHAGDRVVIEPDTDNPTTVIDMGSKRSHVRPVK
jgi:ribosomal protein L21E